MKRDGQFILIFMLLLISVPLIYASEETQVEKAYSCLENRIDQTNCSTFSLEEKVFSLLATENSKCQSQVMLESLSYSNYLCWPKSGCKLKPTAQAALALNKKGINTTKAEEWLLTQTATPTDMDWFLEIESLSATSCAITYLDASYTVSIGENKKISSNAGAYLTLAQNNYWLKISPSIYNKNIIISCDKPFITTLLFMKKDSSTIHVSETVNSAAAKGRTTEIVNSFCFSQGGNCNYEGSLWAAFVLYALNQDVSKFMPYIITMMNEEANQVYIPESFLYFLTGKFRTELLLKQKVGLYWEESQDKYYDTALALWPFYYESPFEKENSKLWLLENQQNSGCWNNGNIRDTAFILYSIWPKSSPSGECVYDNDCPEISCKDASCEEGSCVYEYSSGCMEECDSDNDCDIYVLPDEDNYCSADKTEAWKNDSAWDCENSVCVVNETPKKVEECDEGEECYNGNCLANGDIPDECETYLDCYGDEDCVDGECVSNLLDCEEEGYFCMSDINCGGEILYDYSCIGVFECCDTEIILGECEDDEGGTICSDNEFCLDGTSVDVSDTTYGEVCCVGGTCEEEVTPSANCEDNNGECKSSCGKNEEESFLYDCDYGESCCIVKENQKTSKLWIWILLFLILISALGIIFRDKLRTQWLKLKTLFGGKKDKRFEMSLTPHSGSQNRIFSRGILPPQLSRGPPVRRPMPSHHSLIDKKPEEKTKNELDDVLKKLKDMGK